MHVNVPNGNYARIVREAFAAGGVHLRRVHLHQIPTNECWCRDHGPAFVVRRAGADDAGRGRRLGLQRVGRQVPAVGCRRQRCRHASPRSGACRCSQPGIVMEGGAVEFNGAGTVLTTKSCLLNTNRNPGLSKRAMSSATCCDYYGQSHVLWLGDGIAGDDTDGHIDDLARFIDPRTIVMGIEADPRDENHEVLQENRSALARLRDQDGRPFEVVEIPMPRAVAP